MAIQDLQVIKRSGMIEAFNLDKIITAITKAAEHTFKPISSNELSAVIDYIYDKLAVYDDENSYEIPVDEVHDIVINALFEVRDDVAKRYVSYHEFQNSQNKVFDSLKDLIDISSSVDLPVSQNKLVVERTTAKELAMRYSLRPDWQKAITDGIIEIPNIETLWYKTREVGYIDFAKKFTNSGNDGVFDSVMNFTVMIDALKREILSTYNNYTSALVINLKGILAKYLELSYYRNLMLAKQVANRTLDFNGSTKTLTEKIAVEMTYQEVIAGTSQVWDIVTICKDNHNIDIVFASSSFFSTITDTETINNELQEIFDTAIATLRIVPDVFLPMIKSFSINLNTKVLRELATDDHDYQQSISKYGYMVSDIIASYVKTAGVNQSSVTVKLDCPSDASEFKSIENVMRETELGSNSVVVV